MSFCTAINCIDGRIQLPVIEFLKKHFDAPYVDNITVPGPDLILAERNDQSLVKNILDRIVISVEIHGSKAIAITGHHDCARNPVDEKTHKQQIRKAIAFIKQHYPSLLVEGLWVDENWNVTLIS